MQGCKDCFSPGLRLPLDCLGSMRLTVSRALALERQLGDLDSMFPAEYEPGQLNHMLHKCPDSARQVWSGHLSM